MTPEQQRLVRYAEAMGWNRKGTERYGCWLQGEFGMDRQAFKVKKSDAAEPEEWNPLTDANDALELAVKMDIEFARNRREDTQEFYYDSYRPDVGRRTADTLPDAICAAVDAALERER